MCDLLYGGGCDIGTAAAFLGHSPAVALRHYRRAKPADLRAAAERAGLGRVPGGRILRLAGGDAG